LVVNDGDAARIAGARLYAEYGRRIIGAVDAQGHDDHTLALQGAMQLRHLLL
jgi:hypothetical protein